MANPNGRAALGVRFDNDWYFTFHGQSIGPDPNGNVPQNDSQAMLNSIAAHVAQVPGRQWTVMGDFNNPPGNFPIPGARRRSRIYATGQATQQSGGELDYAVSSTRIQNHPVRRLNGASSDHYAVAIGGLRAAAEPRETLFNSPRVIQNMASGSVLVPGNHGDQPSSDSGKLITIVSRRANDPLQEWDIAFNNTDTVQRRWPSELRGPSPARGRASFAYRYSSSLSSPSCSSPAQWRTSACGRKSQKKSRRSPGAALLERGRAAPATSQRK